MKAWKTTIDPAGGPVHPLRPNESPLVILPALPFRRIAPPSRTPCTSVNILFCAHPGEDQQSVAIGCICLFHEDKNIHDYPICPRIKRIAYIRLSELVMWLLSNLEMLLNLSPPSLNPQGLLYINKDRGFIPIFIIIGQLIIGILFQILERFQHFTLIIIPFPIRIFSLAEHMLPASQVPKQQNI